MKYHHVLFATDFSADSEFIGKRAKLIAESAKAKLSMVHVLEHTPLVYGGGEFSIPMDVNLEETLEKHAKHALEKLGKKLGIPAECQHIMMGSTKKAVVELSEELKADLIVVGSHGHSGITMLLGSTANAILHASVCDVLAVRAPE